LVVVDDAAGVIAPQCGDRRDAAVAAVTEYDTTVEQVRDVWRATMTSLRLPGQHWPATTTRRR
jgi:hypothetical protein